MQTILTPFSWLPIRPQFINPNPPIILDPRFRRAVIHAIDRQAIVDTIQYGMVDVAHSMVNPREPDYPLIEPAVVKYGYDPRLAGQMIADLGYQRGADGFFVDQMGQRLALEIRTTAQRDQQVKAALAVTDNLQRIGVNAEMYNVPLQLIPDREHRANFPGFEIVGGGAGLAASEVRRYLSSSAPLPENGYRATGNNARYMIPEFDALINRYLTTIPKAERLGYMREIVRHQTELVTAMGIFYQIRPTIATPRMLNITPGYDRGSVGWNARDWDVKAAS
jgi:peptide/nickel transport system substrate-binding protein